MAVKCYDSTAVSKTASRGLTPCTVANFNAPLVKRYNTGFVILDRRFDSVTGHHTMSSWISGRSSALQAEETGSIPVLDAKLLLL